MPADARDPPFLSQSPHSPSCMEEPALVQGRMASGPYRPALAPPPSACLRKVLQQPASVLCHTGRAGEKRAGFTLLAHLRQTRDS